jgi:transcriptional regulator with XRE-family HTH domain
MSYGTLRLTGEQIRAGRALARIEQTELASRCGLSLETIKRLERIRGPVEANSRTLDAIHASFAAMGVFFDGCGDGGVGLCRRPYSAGPAPTPDRRARASVPPVPRAANAAKLHRLIYSSAAKPYVTEKLKATIDEIAEVSSRQNVELGITGALFVSGSYFLQALEGSKEAVHQVYGAISADARHSDLRVLESRRVATRQFQDWTLCCGLFHTDGELLVNEPALKDGFRPDALSPALALGLLSQVRDLQSLPPRNGRGRAGGCPLADQCLDRICAASAGKAGLSDRAKT